MNEAYKILWAEDEPMLREIMCELLAAEGYHCTQAKNGELAKEYLETDSFNLLITDFNMPFLTGDHLLFWCRRNSIHIPVIFVTGYMERKQSEELALKDCCTSVIQKPFAIEKLLAEIELAKGRNHEFLCGRVGPSRERPDNVNSFPNQHVKY